MSWLDELVEGNYSPKNLEQGSDKWEQIRAGRFTSSEIWKIMEFGKRPMTPEELKARPKSGKGSSTTQVPDPSKLSEKGMGYITQKVAEVLTGQPKQSAYAYPLVYGKETEPEAVEHFEKITGYTCEEIGFQTWGEHAGGSPDRFIVEVKEGLEIKCPFQSENQIGYLMLTDHHDLKRMYPEYYWQCVSLLLFTSLEAWNFCTYDPRMILDRHKMTRIRIEAAKVEEDMDLVNTAIASAVKEKLSMLATLNASI
jgi:hypothetical protein